MRRVLPPPIASAIFFFRNLANSEISMLCNIVIDERSRDSQDPHIFNRGFKISTTEEVNEPENIPWSRILGLRFQCDECQHPRRKYKQNLLGVWVRTEESKQIHPVEWTESFRLQLLNHSSSYENLPTQEVWINIITTMPRVSSINHPCKSRNIKYSWTEIQRLPEEKAKNL